MSHYVLLKAIERRKGQLITTADINKIMKRENIGYDSPSFHCQRKIASMCQCGGTDERIFDRISQGLYRVR